MSLAPIDTVVAARVTDTLVFGVQFVLPVDVITGTSIGLELSVNTAYKMQGTYVTFTPTFPATLTNPPTEFFKDAKILVFMNDVLDYPAGTVFTFLVMLAAPEPGIPQQTQTPAIRFRRIHVASGNVVATGPWTTHSLDL